MYIFEALEYLGVDFGNGHTPFAERLSKIYTVIAKDSVSHRYDLDKESAFARDLSKIFAASMAIARDCYGERIADTMIMQRSRKKTFILW